MKPRAEDGVITRGAYKEYSDVPVLFSASLRPISGHGRPAARETRDRERERRETRLARLAGARARGLVRAAARAAAPGAGGGVSALWTNAKRVHGEKRDARRARPREGRGVSVLRAQRRVGRRRRARREGRGARREARPLHMNRETKATETQKPCWIKRVVFVFGRSEEID